MGVSFEVYSNGKNKMTIKSYQMNSVLFFVQIILLSQLVLSGYKCNGEDYKAYLNDLTVYKKGFVGHKGGESPTAEVSPTEESADPSGIWTPTLEQYKEYWIDFILKVDIRVSG